MNGGIIGGEYPRRRTRRTGVWNIHNPDLPNIGTAIPTSGLTNYLPLTSDANDTIGSLNMTNNNSVTFSSAGARFQSASSQYLSATITWPSVFTWVIDIKIDSGKYFYLGNQASDGKYACSLGPCVGGDTKIKVNSPRYSDYGGQPAVIDIGYSLTDGLYHTFALVGYNYAPVPNGVNMGVLFCDGECVGGCAFFQQATLSTAFSIGRPGATTSGYGDGYARDFRAYNRILTIDEIRRLSV